MKPFWAFYTTIGITSFKIWINYINSGINYTQNILFHWYITLSIVMKPFWPFYITIGITTLKISNKYTNSGINYAKKCYCIDIMCLLSWNLFWPFYVTISITSLEILRKYTDSSINYAKKYNYIDICVYSSEIFLCLFMLLSALPLSKSQRNTPIVA
jgi:hypothetical protein